MDAGDLHRLVRVLRGVAIAATNQGFEEVSPMAVLVGADVFQHSPTNVTDVVKRTGVVQSQVSTIVAAMQERGMLTAEKDPADGRRRLLTVPDGVRRHYAAQRGSRDPRRAVEDHLIAAGKPHAPDDVSEVLRLLGELSERLV